MIIQEMVYQDQVEIKLLARDNYRGFDYVVLSYGIFPSAFVRIPQNHPYYKKYTGPIPVRCHGGILHRGELKSVSGILPLNEYNIDTDEFWIGWSYMECNDYTGFNMSSQFKKRSTVEMVNDCIGVISQLLSLPKEEDSLS